MLGFLSSGRGAIRKRTITLGGLVMNKTHISLLVLTFLSAMVYQPNWVYENFWSKADFFEDIPFQVPYLVFLINYSFLSTIFVWYVVKFVKKYL